ncbi:MAG: hypothetical protein ACE5F4_02355 [Candidatus Paceibacteria bacterium]
MALQKQIPAMLVALKVISAAGLIATVAVAPGMAFAFKRLGFKRKPTSSYTNHVLFRLKQRGLISYETSGRKRFIRITPRGKQHLASQRIRLLHRPSTRKWDGYWRIVMFDIPETQKKKRDLLRRELSLIGFKKLQGSVWVSPDECEEYIKLLKSDQHIGKNLIYLKTKDIEYGSALRKNFKITKM